MIYSSRILKLSTFFLIFLSHVNLGFSSCEIAIFDCGQGNAIAVRFNGQSMVFDAGRTAYASFVKYDDDRRGDSEINTQYIITENSTHPLKTASVDQEKFTLPGGPVSGNTTAYKELFKTKFKEFVGPRLKSVFISHPDKDHSSLVKELDLQPDIYVLGGMFDLYKKPFRDHIDGKNILGTTQDYDTLNSSNAYKNQQFKTHCKFTGTGSIPTVDILSINANGKGDTNADSMIVKVSHNNRSILITGDAEGETWNDVPNDRRALLQSDVLIIPHHGSLTNESTNEEILAEIRPKVCFISAGFQYAHPSFKVINLLLDYYDTTQYRTTPHYITFFENKIRKAMITNAPIFTTIDNGALFINLSAPLTVNVSRDFSPTPDITLIDKNGVRLFLSLDPSNEFVDLNRLKQLDSKSKLLHDTPFGREVYWIMDSGSKEQYYYKFGDAFLKMKLFEENEEEGTVQVWNKSITEWIKDRQNKKIKVYTETLRFLGTITEL